MGPRPYDWLTFDCYGTLIDWETGIRRAARRLAPRGARLPAGRALARRYIELERQVEAGRYSRYKDILAAALGRLFAERKWPLTRARAGALARELPRWRAFAEVPSVLKSLRRRGYKLAVLSNIDDSLLRKTLPRLGARVDMTVTAQGVRSYKPGPRHWRRFLARAKTRPSRVLHVAASLAHDIRPAGRLGIDSVWINRAREKRPSLPRLLASGADLRVLARLLPLGRRADGPRRA